MYNASYVIHIIQFQDPTHWFQSKQVAVYYMWWQWPPGPSRELPSRDLFDRGMQWNPVDLGPWDPSLERIEADWASKAVDTLSWRPHNCWNDIHGDGNDHGNDD